MTRRYFGTDGIRGRANKFPMTAETAMRVGMATGLSFQRGTHRHRDAFANLRHESHGASFGRRPTRLRALRRDVHDARASESRTSEAPDMPPPSPELRRRRGAPRCT